jgi:hypothetical protein
MASTCEYCQSPCEDGQTNCPNCGAPLTHSGASVKDFTLCPFCGHKLLALGSPACSYCGHRLPDEYIKARTSDLNRITQIEGEKGPHDASSDLLGDTLRVKVTRSTSTFDILSDINNIFSRR